MVLAYFQSCNIAEIRQKETLITLWNLPKFLNDILYFCFYIYDYVYANIYDG